MEINTLAMLRIPIDNTYRNVYSMYKAENRNRFRYASLLISTFTNLESGKKHVAYPIISQNRAFNANKKTTIDVIFSETEFVPESEIYSYNYLMINYMQPDAVFYFITSCKINNSMNKPTYTLYLEWDAWGNNIGKDDLHLTHCYANRATANVGVPRLLTDHYGEFSFSSMNKETRNDLRLQNTITETHGGATLEHNGRTYKMLWKRLYLDVETQIYTYSGIYDEYQNPINIEENEGVISSFKPLRVVYIPVCLVDTKSREINTEINFWRMYNNDTTGTIENQPLTFSGQYDEWEKRYKNLHIVNADLTYQLPAEITLTLYVSQSNPDNNYVLIHIPTTLSVGWGGYFMDGNIRIYGITSVKGMLNKYYNGYDFSIDTSYDLTLSLSDIHNLKTSESLSDRYKMCIPLNMYPYNYKQIRVGQLVIDITGQVDTYKAWATMKTFNRNNIALKLLQYQGFDYYNSLKNMAKYEYANNNGSLIYDVDNLAQYLRDNQNSINTNLQLSTLTAIAGAATGNPIAALGGLYSVAKTFTQTTAKLKDIDNGRNEIKSGDNIAPNDIEFQDDLLITENKINSSAYKQLELDYLSHNGIIINTSYFPFSPNNHSFDYILGSDVTIRGITNDEDKKRIENAIENGITCWYLDTAEPGAIRKLSHDYINIPKAIYDYYLEEYYS